MKSYVLAQEREAEQFASDQAALRQPLDPTGRAEFDCLKVQVASLVSEVAVYREHPGIGIGFCSVCHEEGKRGVIRETFTGECRCELCGAVPLSGIEWQVMTAHREPGKYDHLRSEENDAS